MECPRCRSVNREGGVKKPALPQGAIQDSFFMNGDWFLDPALIHEPRASAAGCREGDPFDRP